MLTVIVSTLVVYVLTIAIEMIKNSKFKLSALLIGLVPAACAFVVSLAVAGILGSLPIDRVESNHKKYPLISSEFEGQSYYVLTDSTSGEVKYHFTFVDSTDSVVTVDADGDCVRFRYNASSTFVNYVTLSAPQGWELWTLGKSYYVYEINIPSLQDIRTN